MECPPDAFRYNGTLCACNPGYLYNSTSNSCSLFSNPGPAVVLNSGVNYDVNLGSFPETIFAFDSIKKFTQSQAVFLEATLVMLLCWLSFCLVLRLIPLGSDGRSPWFKMRWLISRLDVSFATRHWLQDQKPVVKRKTELGGAFSMASWILFIGLFAALLYQIISNRSVEVHNVRASNEPDLASFLNDLQFNITTVSSMSCAQLRGLGTMVSGNPGFVDRRVVPLSTFASYSCHNTTLGPTISLQCTDCRLMRDLAYISWQFVDLPNNPATAVGFQFNLTAKSRDRQKHLSSVNGILKNDSNFDGRPLTYRGTVPNILKFNLFPRVYHNLHELKLLQPLFHEFLPGSSFGDINQLQASLQSSSDGVVNTTLLVNFLSSYIIEIDNQNILGPVSFLADLGGLYCISIGIFFYLLVQCEYRIKKLRYEDSTMRNIRSRRKAQDRWEKLRKYVMYTWGSSLSDDNDSSETNQTCCAGVMKKSLHQNGSAHKRRPNRTDSINFSIQTSMPEPLHAQVVTSGSNETVSNAAKVSGSSEHRHEDLSHGAVKHEKDESSLGSNLQDSCQKRRATASDTASIPPVPPFEFKDPTEISLIDLHKNLENLYKYNVMLREKLIETQTMLHVAGENEPPSMGQ